MMRMYTLAALAALAISAAAPSPVSAARLQSGAEVVTLNRDVVIEGDIVRLGDIFSGLGEKSDTAIARAPALGKKVPVGVRWLTAVAQKYSLPWRPSSRLDSAVIQRASTVITSQRIKAEVQDALASEGLEQNARLEFDAPSMQLILPREIDDSVRISAVSYDPANGRFSVEVSAPAEGTPSASTTIRGRAIKIVEVPVLRRRINSGEIIRHDDLDWVSHRADRLFRNALLDADAIVGKSPRRSIGAGLVLKASELKTPEMVSKNSLVTIRVETERMVLTAQGRALEAGAKGEAIRVVNTKSNTLISAEVTDYGIVRAVMSNHVVTH